MDCRRSLFGPLACAALLLACNPSDTQPTATQAGCSDDSECAEGMVCSDGACVSSDTSTTQGTSTTAGSTACNFVCEPDAEFQGDECDVFAQDCDEGEKCVAYDQDGNGSRDSTQCVEVMGNGQDGDACTAEEGLTGVDDCAKGIMCWNTDDEGNGQCVLLCSGSPEAPMCPPSDVCVIANGGVLNLCLTPCDPLVQNCLAGDTCVANPTGGSFICVHNSGEGMAPIGTPCEFLNTCNPGLFCASLGFFNDPGCSGADGCCAPYCDLANGDADCDGLLDGMAECVPWYEEGTAPPGYSDVGGCGIPS